MADPLRRLFRAALQPAHADRVGQRQEPRARLDLSRLPAGGGELRRRVPAGRSVLLGRAVRDGHDQGDAADGGRRALSGGARPRLCGRRAHREGDLALLLADARRHPHRQPRRRPARQRPLLRDAGLLPRVARCHDRPGTLAQGDRRRQAAVFLHAGADRDRQPRDRRHRRRFARRAGVSSSRATRTPAICNGAGTPRRRRRATPGRRPGRTNTR